MIRRMLVYPMQGLALCCGLTAQPSVADVIDTSGQAAWESCGYCHGIEGLSSAPLIPHLAGQSRSYLVKQLKDFGSGRRQNSGGIMPTQVEALEQGTIRVLADYFSSQAAPQEGTLQTPVADTVRQLYHNGDTDRKLPACVSCHGSGFAGIPRLEGQQPAYISKQLDDFASGLRANAPPGTMGAIADRLTAAEREALGRLVYSLGQAIGLGAAQ